MQSVYKILITDLTRSKRVAKLAGVYQYYRYAGLMDDDQGADALAGGDWVALTTVLGADFRASRHSS